MQLDPTAVAAGVRLSTRDEIGSTNTEALALARAGGAGPLWITARRQTAGRGRRGRNWVSEPGNLYASLLLTDPPAARAAELSFVAALALHDAIADVAPGLGPWLALKWPNDLLLNGAKLAGILIEGEQTTDGLAAAIGFGVNCATHPADMAFAATSLIAAGALVSPEHLFQSLSATMLRRLLQWSRGDGFASTRRDWLARAAGCGEQIRVRLPERELIGRFEALDESGRLMLRLPDGTAQAITAGEVFALDPARPQRASGEW
jgi:BirA family biotin operon repressor/biotin-[acetyl-CoA-carboxylase] ligase